jgi:V8-like Glu-specific endopeptidase
VQLYPVEFLQRTRIQRQDASHRIAEIFHKQTSGGFALIYIIASGDTLGDFVRGISPLRVQMQGPYARLLRRILTALLMLAAVVGTAVGDTFDDALAAYQKGDYAIALQLFRALADDGREDAQYNLGFMYFSGKGVAQDYAEAANWYRLAADQGFARSQYALGSMYFNGWGVRQDYILAFMWFDLSAARGHQAAVSARDNVAKQMTPAQIAEAQNRAGGWRPTLHRETVDVGIYPWSSIGKVGVTSVTLGKGCSGAVIGTNEFLTAAHCLYNKTTKRFFPAGSIHLLLGYSRGEYRAPGSLY